MKTVHHSKSKNIISLFAVTLLFTIILCGCGKEKNISVTPGNIVVDTGNVSAQGADEETADKGNRNDSAVSNSITINMDGAAVDDSSISSDDANADESAEASTSADALSDDLADKTGASTTPDSTEAVNSATSTDPAMTANSSVTPGSTEYISLNPAWQYADFSKINSGQAVLYRAANNRKNIIIGVNAGHGTKGGQSVKTYCHPDMSAKVTGGTTGAGAITAYAVSSGMSFYDGTPEASVTLAMANTLKDVLLSSGYDVLMLRDGADVQLDNVARTVIANNTASCHIAIHWDGDGLNYDKGCFYISTPDGIKNMEPVASNWAKHEALGASLISGLTASGCTIYKNGSMAIDLTQTSFSTIPSVDIELGNAASSHDNAALTKLATGIATGINNYFGQ